MKITGQNLNRSVGTADAGKADKTDKLGNNSANIGRPESAAAGALGSASKVNVSERAQAMQRAKEIAGDQSVDEAKVARLQKMIDSGEYKVDAKSVADRMVDAHLLFPE